MIEAFAPKDIENLRKLAGLLTIPFFSAAVYMDFGLWVLERDTTLSWLTDSNLMWMNAPSKVVAFIIGVFFVAIIFEFLRLAFAYFPRLYYFVGFSLLSFGLLALSAVLPQDSPNSVNLYWHLGCLCWGLDIFGASNTPKP